MRISARTSSATIRPFSATASSVRAAGSPSARSVRSCSAASRNVRLLSCERSDTCISTSISDSPCGAGDGGADPPRRSDTDGGNEPTRHGLAGAVFGNDTARASVRQCAARRARGSPLMLRGGDAGVPAPPLASRRSETGPGDCTGWTSAAHSCIRIVSPAVLVSAAGPCGVSSGVGSSWAVAGARDAFTASFFSLASTGVRSSWVLSSSADGWTTSMAAVFWLALAGVGLTSSADV